MPDAVKINKFGQEQSSVLKFQMSKRRLSFCYQKEGCIFNIHLMEGKSEKCFRPLSLEKLILVLFSFNNSIERVLGS